MGLTCINLNTDAAQNGSIVAYFANSDVRRDTMEFFGGHNIIMKTIDRRRELILAMSARQPDLIILEIDCQRGDGLDLIRDVRCRCTAPLFVLADGGRDEIDRTIALEMGADAYLTRPFNLHELIARLRLALWRQSLDPLPLTHRHDRHYVFAGWLLDERARQLRNPVGIPVPLTKSEFNLLSAFLHAPRRTLSREHLSRATRMHENASDRSIDVQVLRLRRKLEPEKRSAKLIRTERGGGYVFDVDTKLILPQDSRPATFRCAEPKPNSFEMGSPSSP